MVSTSLSLYLFSFGLNAFPIPRLLSVSLISPRIVGSSIVDGITAFPSSAKLRMVFLRILPDLVLGNLFTIAACLKFAMAPILLRIICTNSGTKTSFSIVYPSLRTTKPAGTCPLSSSSIPIRHIQRLLHDPRSILPFRRWTICDLQH